MASLRYNDSQTKSPIGKSQMKKLFVTILAAGFGFGFMSGCSSEPSKPAPAETSQPKAPQTTTGSSAFFKCYVSARGWAVDVQPYRVESHASADAKGRDGKSGDWSVGFASSSLHSVKSYTWSNGDISHGVDDNYSPSNSNTQVFDVQALKVDTDKAFAVAQEHGGDQLLQKEPDTPVLYVLAWDRPTNRVLWHVIYGTNPETAKLRVAVNATSGEFLRVEK
jgi:hypothetical protein